MKMGNLQLFLFSSVLIGCVVATPLDDYVNKPDSHYAFADTGLRVDTIGATGYVLNMTSQKWLDESITTCSIWYHTLTVFVPDNLTQTEFGFLWITGGDNGNKPSTDPKDQDNAVAAMMAVTTGMVTAALFQVPNEPCYFAVEDFQKRRTEDAIIALTWRHFIDNPDQPEWLLRLPMTKAGVRALDTLSAWGREVAGTSITKFFVAGASKRGWTTWTVGAVDKRVVGIIPIVMDELNFVKNIHHHYMAYGGWSFALEDYWVLNITLDLDRPETQQMMDIVDPYSYRDRLTMPKYIVSTSGDEFFLPDDSYYYLDQMQGPTYMRIVQDAEHSLALHAIDLFMGVQAFVSSIVFDAKRPEFSWTRECNTENGTIVIKTDPNNPPTAVTMWHARTLSTERRDFRLLAQGVDQSIVPQPVFWLWEDVKADGNGVYTAYKDKGDGYGWEAFFVELMWNGPDTFPYKFTTEVCIVPNTLPFPRCTGLACIGKLV